MRLHFFNTKFYCGKWNVFKLSNKINILAQVDRHTGTHVQQASQLRLPVHITENIQKKLNDVISSVDLLHTAVLRMNRMTGNIYSLLERNLRITQQATVLSGAVDTRVPANQMSDKHLTREEEG
jgi:hypothetical protein